MKRTSKVMWKRGSMDFRMEFITTCKPDEGVNKHEKNTIQTLHIYVNKKRGGRGVSLGTPETSLRGLRTLKARRAFMSNPPPFSPTGASTPLMWLMASTATVKRLEKQRHPFIYSFIGLLIGSLLVRAGAQHLPRGPVPDCRSLGTRSQWDTKKKWLQFY